MLANSNRPSGFSLIEMLVVSLVVAGLSLGIAKLFSSSLKGQFRINTTFNVDQIRKNLSSTVQNSSAWLNTINDTSNLNLACLRSGTACTHNNNPTTGSPAGVPLADKPFMLKDAANNIVYDPVSSASNGFTPTGSLCSTYSDSGNDACPIRYELTWTAVCSGSCINPQVKVKGTMKYRPSSPQRDIAMNSENYSFEVTPGQGAGTGTSKISRVKVTLANSPYSFIAPPGTTSVWLTMCGGGGGGAGDAGGSAGLAGRASSFGTLKIVNGGGGGSPAYCCWGPGPGGAAGGWGGMKGPGGWSGTLPTGGNSIFGVGGTWPTEYSTAGPGMNGTGYGAGGSGGSDGISHFGGGGGGAECVLYEELPVTPGSTYVVTIGAGGAGGGGSFAGGAGSPGFALIEW